MSKTEKNRKRYLARKRCMVEAKKKGDHPRLEWEKMVRFFKNRCVRCNKYDFMSPDHIVPVSREGSNSIRNLQPLCAFCNQQKGWWDIVDYRPSYCDEHGLVMPEEWAGNTIDDSLQ